jgi:Flp pilus assembly protein protease CpaA
MPLSPVTLHLVSSLQSTSHHESIDVNHITISNAITISSQLSVIVLSPLSLASKFKILKQSKQSILDLLLPSLLEFCADR